MSKVARLAAVVALSIGAMSGFAPPATAVPVVPDPAVRATLIAGDQPSSAEDVNARGTVVGGVVVGEGEQARTRPYTWTHGRLRLLDSPNTDGSSFAVGINRRGDVLVQADGGTRLRARGHWREFAATGAVALNDAGDALLSAPFLQDLASPNRALLWRDGRLLDLVPPGTLPGWAVFPTALNDAGQVLLRVYGENLATVEGSFVWTDGRFVQLQPSQPDGIVEPMILDDRGRASGRAGPPGGLATPAVWDHDGRVTILPTAEGSIGSDLRDANNVGQLVGYSAFPAGTNRITLYTDGRPTLLPDHPGTTPLGDSVEINDLGQVAWTERSDDDGTAVGFAWWFGHQVVLGDGTVTDIGDGGDVIGYAQPGGNGTSTFGLHWAVHWPIVLHRR
jgi:uncharacterized membrane protein